MKRHICNNCRKVIFIIEDNYKKIIDIDFGLCSSCSLSIDDKKQLKRDAQDWRNEKIAEILDKKNPNNIDKLMLNNWSNRGLI